MESQNVTPNSSNSYMEMSINNPSLVFPTRANFYSSCKRQKFSLPVNTLIYYISKNPSTFKLYKKLIHSCKYFFIKKPIIIVPRLYFNDTDEWYARPSKGSHNDRFVYLNELTSEIWITDSLDVWGGVPKKAIITCFMPQIYQCDVQNLFINAEHFSFNDLIVIASKCKNLHLSDVLITNNDAVIPETKEGSFYFGTAVSLEVLFKVLPNVKTFKYYLPKNSLNIITTKTATELLKIRCFLSLDKFKMSEIPEIFDIKSFYGHMKENKKTKIKLHFSGQISDEYKLRLQTIVNEILVKNSVLKLPYKLPVFDFPDMTPSSNLRLKKLHSLLKRNVQKEEVMKFKPFLQFSSFLCQMKP